MSSISTGKEVSVGLFTFNIRPIIRTLVVEGDPLVLACPINFKDDLAGVAEYSSSHHTASGEILLSVVRSDHHRAIESRVEPAESVYRGTYGFLEISITGRSGMLSPI